MIMKLTIMMGLLAIHSHGFYLLQQHPLRFTPMIRSSSIMTQLSMAVTASSSCQLAQLASMTTLSIDSGDLKVIEEYAKTGYITDATTNPLFVSQAGLSGDPTYAEVCVYVCVLSFLPCRRS